MNFYKFVFILQLLATTYSISTTSNCKIQCDLVCDHDQSLHCAPSCDSGWTYFASTVSCYKVFLKKTWADAEAQCVLFGAHLTSIHSDSENTFVNGLASTGNHDARPFANAWIGMHKINGEWTWTDGTKTDYFKWASGEPNNPKTELCVLTTPDHWHQGYYQEWNDSICKLEIRASIFKKAANK